MSHEVTPEPVLQVKTAERTLGVPKHGSPKVVVFGKTVHAFAPVHAAATMDVELPASQEPRVKDGHVPEGFP